MIATSPPAEKIHPAEPIPEHEPQGHHMHYDPTAHKIGMWCFLFGEMLLFVGMFLLYAVSMKKYPIAYMWGSTKLDMVMGCVNTVFLLTSSLTVVLAIAAIQHGNRKMAQIWLAATLAFAAAFFVVKGIEWSHKIHSGIYPNSPYLEKLAETPLGEVHLHHQSRLTPEKVAELEANGRTTVGRGIVFFYALYYIMTGLHGIHVFIGMLAIASAMWLIARGKIGRERYSYLENTGLYWHLVDLIWIFLFPLFYLIG